MGNKKNDGNKCRDNLAPRKMRDPENEVVQGKNRLLTRWADERHSSDESQDLPRNT